MFAYQFVRDAYLAGTLIALACGLVGWFVVLRSQVFAGDALSHVAFTGAVAAAALGIDTRVGLFAATLGLAGLMAGVGRTGVADDVAIGTVFSWILGIGVFFVALGATGPTGGGAISTADTLFGSIFGLDTSAARLAAAIGLGVAAIVLLLARPLLFASVDPAGARAHGVPVRTLGVIFLLLLGTVAGEATQAVGALLMLGLIAAPAGAARRLTANPWLGLALAPTLAVASMWTGLAVSYAVPRLPPSTAVILTAAGAYFLANTIADRRLSRAARPAVDGGVA